MIFTASFLPIDGLTLFMLVLLSLIAPAIVVFSFCYVRRNVKRYYGILFLTLIGMLGAVLARDFLSLYIFIELMTVGIYFLIIDNFKERSFVAAFKYILMMFSGGILILVATLLLFNITGSFEYAIVKQMIGQVSQLNLNLIISLYLIGFLLEIGAVPFHVWLPDAYPLAPSPISALMAGLVSKIGLYSLIRIMITLKSVSPVLIVFGVVSMLFGVFAALKQTNTKRLLAYSSISQIGYIILGLGLGTTLGLKAGLFHIINHATFEALLFLSIGSVIYSTGRRELKYLGGLGSKLPITTFAFVVGALAISGLPPFNAFASKAMLSSAVGNNMVLKFVIIITAAGTVASFFKLYKQVFAGQIPSGLNQIKSVPFTMQLAMMVIAGFCLAFGLWPNLVLAKFIGLASGEIIGFDFLTWKNLSQTLLIVFLGGGIYWGGLKLGYFKSSRWPSWLSLDQLSYGFAALIEKLCDSLKRVMRNSLNVYLFWIILTFLSLLVFLRF